MRPDRADVAIEIVYDASEGTVITARIAIPGGSVELMGEIAERGRSLVVTGVHVVVSGVARAADEKRDGRDLAARDEGDGL